MNRNNESHFLKAPSTTINRSTFPVRFDHKTTFNLGALIPFYINLDVLPSDTWQLNCTYVIRLSTPVKPIMDNIYIDTYFFAIPWRILWEHTKEFFGENKNGAWSSTVSYVIPQYTTPTGGAAKGTLMDYMGIPTGIGGLTFSALGLRAYTLVVNEFFRDQNYIAPYTEYTDDTDRTADNTVMELGGLPFQAARFHSMFSTMLPEPQKSSGNLPGPVTIPIGTSAPVIGNGMSLGLQGQLNGTTVYTGLNAQGGDTVGSKVSAYGTQIGASVSGTQGIATDTAMGLTNDPTKSGAIADLSAATGATINALRYAFALQRIMEQWSRTGTRFTEQIQAFYHTQPYNAVLQRPEYLGGKRVPLNMQSAVQTSSTDNTTPQGNLAAFSHTVDSDRMFTKSFTEWSVVIGLMVARQDHSFAQGLAKQWKRRRLLDIYNPKLCNIGEMPIYNYQWYAQGPSAVNSTSGLAYDDEIAGYNEAWVEYRTEISRVSGAFRPQYAQTLAVWHLSDYYTSMPVMGQTWLSETPDYLDRCLAVPHTTEDQFLADILVTGKKIRPMSAWSVPGLIDHF